MTTTSLTPSPTGRRNAALLFSPELADGTLVRSQLRKAGVSQAMRSRPVPPGVTRLAQRLAMNQGLLSYERASIQPMIDLRRSVLGDAADGPPRLLLRVDEFPRAGRFDSPEPTREMLRFHEIVRAAGIPYLLAVTPKVAENYLDPRAPRERSLLDEEIGLLHDLAADGVTFALHGLTHRTVSSDPHRHSEFCDRTPGEVADMLDEGLAILEREGIATPVFVPPFNRFDAEHYDTLSARFSVVCGGPETVRLMGFHASPLWRGESVYLPCYAPLYARAARVAAGVERVIAMRSGLWTPVTLHLAWEADDGWGDLERLVDQIAPFVSPWSAFLEAVEASRSAGDVPAAA